jgi:hypothetical protein
MNNLDDVAMEQLFSFGEISSDDFTDIWFQPCDVFNDPWMSEELDFGTTSNERLFNQDEWLDFQDLYSWSIDPAVEVADTASVSHTIHNNLQLAESKACMFEVRHDVSPIQTTLPLQEQQSPRTFESCVREFSCSNQDIKRKRRQFSVQRRREVKEIRKAGACLRCRIMKIPVSTYLLPTLPETNHR